MLTVCGFNGFGQFGAEHGRRISQAKVIKTAASSDIKSGVLAVAAWSYTAFAAGCQLWLQGFLQHKPNANLTLTTTEPIKQLAACDKYCLVLLESGKLYKIVPKSDSVLQELKFANLDEDLETLQALSKKRNSFGEVRSNLDTFKITHIACGAQLACAISSTNGVYNIPSKIHQFPKHMRVQQLVCGFEHALLLTTNGDVYAWGNGIRGQLGLEQMGIKEYPTLIDALAGIKITCISAGGWHSAAISAFGDLYTCGFNPNGQLGLRVFKDDNGLKNPTVYPLPQLVNLPSCCPSENAASAEVQNECAPLITFCGSRHTFLQMSCGAVYASGWNAHGQLGLVSKQNFIDQFSRVDIEDTNIDVVCGAWCTIFKKRNISES